MLNPFPFLLAFGQIGPFLTRIAIGFLFAAAGSRKLFQRCDDFETLFASFGIPRASAAVKILGALELASGVALLAGFGTQIAALITAVIALVFFGIKVRRPESLAPNLVYYALIFVMSLSLLVSGAGAFAFDLPL